MAYEALPKGIEVPEGGGGVNGTVDGVTGKGKDGKEARGRFVDVGVFPMGIDVRALKEKRWVLRFLLGMDSNLLWVELTHKSRIGSRF